MASESQRLTGRASFIGAVLCAAMALPAVGKTMINPFHDPFERVTWGLRRCVAPSPPSYTDFAMREEEHWRVEQGNSCYLAGKCRYSNSYFYDDGIARRVKRRLAASILLHNSSIWILVQGRIVELSGCISTPSQIGVAERLVRQDTDVQGIVTHLMVGIQGDRPYK